MINNIKKLLLIIILLFPFNLGAKESLPIGMNLPSIDYWVPSLLFVDAMKSSGAMFTFVDAPGASWDSGHIDSIPRDSDGWPTVLPFEVGGEMQSVRILLNSNYDGEYVLLYDGEGSVSLNNIPNQVVDGRTHVTFSGVYENVWLEITESSEGNHIRNMRLIPLEYLGRENDMPTFRDDYKSGLAEFESLRFMDLAKTNNSSNQHWADRTKKTSYTQSENGIAWEYMIELSNELGLDPWICVPHMATDDYIRQLANLWYDDLNSNRTLHLEFSNEMWNWMFGQAGYVLNNAPAHPNSYVSSDLASIAVAGSHHPEKDAYMMARTFRLFREVWGSDMYRVNRIASGQHAWVDNSRRILEYLFNTDGEGADTLSVGGYFGFDSDDHSTWNAMNPSVVTADMILNSAQSSLDSHSAVWTRESAEFAKQYGVDYMVYEGGQHMQPYNQGVWDYNHAVYDSQIHPRMYELYIKNFNVHLEPEVDCNLFMAFSYIGERESRWGSWGHLENLDQLSNPSTLLQVAPKYQSLLDINTSSETECSDGVDNDGDGQIDFLNDAECNSLMDLSESSTESVTVRADVNGDSSINSSDALLVLRRALGRSMSGTSWQASVSTGDVNCDGSVTTIDALLTLREHLGLDNSSSGWCDS